MISENLVENKFIFRFLKAMKNGYCPKESEFQDYYNMKKEILSEEYHKYIFTLLMQNFTSLVDSNSKISGEAFNNFISIITKINKEISNETIELFKELVRYISISDGEYDYSKEVNSLYNAWKTYSNSENILIKMEFLSRSSNLALRNIGINLEIASELYEESVLLRDDYLKVYKELFNTGEVFLPKLI